MKYTFLAAGYFITTVDESLAVLGVRVVWCWKIFFFYRLLEISLWFNIVL